MIATAVFVLATGSPAGAQAPAQDSVTGSATTGIGRSFTAYDFDVHSGPSGENPTGTVTFGTIGGSTGPLEVTCLNVSGTRASIVVEAPPGNPAGAAGVAIAVEDDGPGQDRIDFHLLTALPTSCPIPSQVVEPTVFGDVSVVDAQPVPTSKDQCKNGGWRLFAGFKNQGDCVSFVVAGR